MIPRAGRQLVSLRTSRIPGPAGRGGSLAGPAGAEEQLKWRDLADDFNVRDPRKRYRLARQRDLDVTQAMAFEALKADVGRQVQAPRPRALGKSKKVSPRMDEGLGKNAFGPIVL